MIRRMLGLAGICVVLALATAASAAVPDGPRLGFVSLANDKPGTLRLESVAESGSARTTLVRGGLKRGSGPMPFFDPSWSPDGSRLAFTVSAGKRREIFTIGADGSGLRTVRGTKGGANPVFSPDGGHIAFERSRFRADVDDPVNPHFYSSTTTWILDLSTGATKRLTPWRNGWASTPGSFSPDGSTLALTINDDNLDGPRVVLVRLDGSGSRVLVRDASEPAISFDGTQVALVSYTDGNTIETEEGGNVPISELYVMRTDGTQIRRLTRTSSLVESRPSWDPSGQRIAYNQSFAGAGLSPALKELFSFGNSLMQVNADGTCAQKILSLRRVAIYGGAWRPGPGREAGRISC